RQLLDQCGSRGRLAGEQEEGEACGEGDGELCQRTGITGELDLTGGERVPDLVIPEIRGGDVTGEPETTHRLLAGEALTPKRAQRLPQHGCPSPVALGGPERQAIQQEIGRARGLQ